MLTVRNLGISPQSPVSSFHLVDPCYLPDSSQHFVYLLALKEKHPGVI
jgi:hypothetical protein